MKEIIEDTVAAMRELFKERTSSCAPGLPERVPPVTADLDRIVQVMLNLLSNAVKFCDPRRRPRRDRAHARRTTACASTCATTARASSRGSGR